jgi:hypothetical protein
MVVDNGHVLDWKERLFESKLYIEVNVTRIADKQCFLFRWQSEGARFDSDAIAHDSSLDVSPTVITGQTGIDTPPDKALKNGEKKYVISFNVPTYSCHLGNLFVV